MRPRGSFASAGASTSYAPSETLLGASGTFDQVFGRDEPAATKDARAQAMRISINQQEDAYGVYRRHRPSGPINQYNIISIGETGEPHVERVRRRQLLQSTGLTPRELRRIDPALTLNTSAPALVVLDHAALIHLGGIRAAVFPDRCVIFDAGAPSSLAFARQLSARLQQRHRLQMQVANIHARTNSHGGYLNMAFELEVLDVAFLETLGELEALLESTSPLVDSILELQGPPQISARTLEELRTVKQALVFVDKRADTLENLLMEVLEDPDDIRGMRLTVNKECGLGYWRGDPTAVTGCSSSTLCKASEEVENLLEYFLQRTEVLVSESARLLENVRDFEESLQVSLSARRLEVNRLELMLQIFSFAVSLGALVTGIFGMNLLSGLEEHVCAFWVTVGGIVGGIVALSVLLLAYVRFRQNIVEGIHDIFKKDSTKAEDELRAGSAEPVPVTAA